MAEINTGAGQPHNRTGLSGLRPASIRSARGGRRCKKLSTRVDMTPMVDLGFLLITFFVFTTTMSRPRALQLIKPADGDSTNIGRNATLTVVPLGGNKIFYYHGDLPEALRTGSFGTASYGRNSGIGDSGDSGHSGHSGIGHSGHISNSSIGDISDIGDIIRQKQVAMDHSYKGGRKEMMLLIKPSPESSYGNVVSLLNETLINNIQRYALVQLTPQERSDFSSKIL